MMQIKPHAATSPLATAPQPAKPAPGAGKPGDFAQMLKTAQADTPATPASSSQG